jgi:hypothetical protein
MRETQLQSLVSGMLREAIECVSVKPLRFDANAPVPPGEGVKLPSGRSFFLRDDGVVAGVSEDEMLAHFLAKAKSEAK